MAYKDTSGQMVVTGTWPNITVSDPNGLFTSGNKTVSNTTAGQIQGTPLNVLQTTTNGLSGKELNSIVDAIGSISSGLGSSLGSGMSSIAEQFGQLQELITKNTDKNYAWNS